jgi:hypothetical protein
MHFGMKSYLKSNRNHSAKYSISHTPTLSKGALTLVKRLAFGLVCFKETKFLEFTFLIFPCLVTLRKVSQRKIVSGQNKKTAFYHRKVFSFPCQKENTFLSLHKTLLKPPLSVYLLPKTIEATVEAGRIENHISGTLFISDIFFPQISLFLYIIFFMFLSSLLDL